MQKCCFTLDESLNHYSTLSLHNEFRDLICKEKPINGSFLIIAARILDLSWQDFIIYCVQHGAEVKDNKVLYPSIRWYDSQKTELYSLVNLLNKRAKIVLQNFEI